jgi:ribosomal protein S19
MLFKKIIVFKKKKKFFSRKLIFFSRASTVPKCFLNYHFRIHKGLIFRRLVVNLYNVGYKFGEFSFTRKPFHFPIKKSQKKKNFYLRK